MGLHRLKQIIFLHYCNEFLHKLLHFKYTFMSINDQRIIYAHIEDPHCRFVTKSFY